MFYLFGVWAAQCSTLNLLCIKNDCVHKSLARNTYESFYFGTVHTNTEHLVMKRHHHTKACRLLAILVLRGVWAHICVYRVQFCSIVSTHRSCREEKTQSLWLDTRHIQWLLSESCWGRRSRLRSCSGMLAFPQVIAGARQGVTGKGTTW